MAKKNLATKEAIALDLDDVEKISTRDFFKKGQENVKPSHDDLKVTVPESLFTPEWTEEQRVNAVNMISHVLHNTAENDTDEQDLEKDSSTTIKESSNKIHIATEDDFDLSNVTKVLHRNRAKEAEHETTHDNRFSLEQDFNNIDAQGKRFKDNVTQRAYVESTNSYSQQEIAPTSLSKHNLTLNDIDSEASLKRINQMSKTKAQATATYTSHIHNGSGYEIEKIKADNDNDFEMTDVDEDYSIASGLNSSLYNTDYNNTHNHNTQDIENMDFDDYEDEAYGSETATLSHLLAESTNNSIISLKRVGNAQPKKELIESIKHGTSIFPLACYVIDKRKYSTRVSLHWHPEVELVRFTKGKFKVTIDMQDIIINNDAFLLLPGNIMHTFTLPANCIESAIVFDARMLIFQDYDEVQSETFQALISGNMPLPPIITPEHPGFTEIDKLYNYCLNNYQTDSAAQRLVIKAKLLEIMSIYHEYGLVSRKEIHTNIKRSKQDKLKELLNYIDTHFAGPISIHDASSRLGVTDQYFCRFFKRVTGMSFTEYLNDVRLRRAAKQIEFTNRAIADIAFEHGFENAGYFFKIFKAKFGMTPLKFRKSHQHSLINA